MLTELPPNFSKTLLRVFLSLRQFGGGPGGRGSCLGESGVKATAVQTLRDLARWLAILSRYFPCAHGAHGRDEQLDRVIANVIMA